MVAIWKVFITIFLLYITTTDANHARRRRRRQSGANTAQQPSNLNSQGNVYNPQAEPRQQQLMPGNAQILNAPRQPQQQSNQGEMMAPKDVNLGQGQGQSGRQYYQNQYGYGQQGQYGLGQQGQYGYGQQGQYGYGQQGSNYYPPGTQYSSGLYGQTGQGIGPYGAYYNQNPGSSSFYSGSNTGYNSYNRPGYSNNYPSSGNAYYGGSNSFWNAGQKANVNIFTILLSSLFAFVMCLIAV